MYKVKQEDLIGDVKDFPIEVVQKMVERQVEQGNVADVAIFQKSKEGDMTGGGFNWCRSTDMRASSIEASKLNIPEIETQGLTESFVNDFKEYLNTIEKQIMYARTLLNDIKPEPLLPDVDFSILNDEDWFYVETIEEGEWVGKGNIIERNTDKCIHYCITSGSVYYNARKLINEGDILLLRKATLEDLAPMFEKHPELAPPKIGDWGVFLDDNYDGIAIGRIEELEWDSDDDGAWNVYYLHGQPYGRFYKINPDEPFNKIVDDFIKSVES